MSFTVDISKFVHKTKAAGIGYQRRITREIFIGVVTRTPIRTGRARASWRVGVNAIDDSVADPAPAGTLSPHAGQAGQVPPDALELAIADNALLKLKAGDVTYVSNSLPYAQRLEDGWSQQAPAGMVAVTLQDLGWLEKPAADLGLFGLSATGSGEFELEGM